MSPPNSSVGNAPKSPGGYAFAVIERIMFVVPLLLTGWLATAIVSVAEGRPLAAEWNWVPSLGVTIGYTLDGLSLVFALLIAGIGTLIFAYAPGYMGRHPDRGRLYAWLFLFMLAMLGLVLASNVIALFVFWELTSMTSYMLIGFKHGSEKARSAALQALLVTGLGGLALLAGLLLLGYIAGSYEIAILLKSGQAFGDHELIVPAIALVLLGAFTKSAQFPFHGWLPAAMEAPTPVSAYLHSATMVKAGVYLVARLSPALGGIPAWDGAVAIAGAVTAVAGGVLALGQSDLKRILAYSTVSALGMLMLLLGVGTPLAIKAATVFLICHSFYKGGLFMVAGTIDHSTGTRDVNQLGGLIRVLPFSAVAATLTALSNAGVPPLGGFLAKEIAYDVAGKFLPGSAWMLAAIFLANVAFVCVACLVAWRPFFTHGQIAKQAVGEGTWHRSNWRLAGPPLLLGLLGLAVGLLAADFATYFVAPAVSAIAGESVAVKLALWHGVNLPLLLSVLTLAIGLIVYFSLKWWLSLLSPLKTLERYGPAAGYESGLKLLKIVAAWQTNVLQNGRLRRYLLVILVTFIGLVGFQLVDQIKIPRGGPVLELKAYELFIPVLILCAALMAVLAESRLVAVCALGAIGYSLAMLFIMYGAPDVAMTQLAIETLTVILFVFVIYRLPRLTVFSSFSIRLRDAIVAVLGGAVMTAVVIAATFAHAPSRVTPYFFDNSLSAAKARNVVNVILVDFRAIDTLGEITVLAVAALGILALMRLRLSPGDSQENPAIHDSVDGAIHTRELASMPSGDTAQSDTAQADTPQGDTSQGDADDSFPSTSSKPGN